MSVGSVVFTTGLARTDSVFIADSLNCGNAGFLLPWRCGCRLSESVFGKPVPNVRVNLHKCKMKLLFVWGPRMCVEFRSIEQFHHHHNILVFSHSGDQVSNCVIEQLEYVLQPILFQVIREAFEPCCAVYVVGYSRKHGTSFATRQWTVCAVAMKGYRECVRQRDRPTFPRASKTRSSTHTRSRKGRRSKDLSNQCASQVAVTWRSYDERS